MVSTSFSYFSNLCFYIPGKLLMKNQVINGDFYMTNIYSDGNSKEWNGTAERGSWVYMSKNKRPNIGMSMYNA